LRRFSAALVALLLAGPVPVAAASADDPQAELADFIATPGARTGCLRLDRPEASGIACFDVQVSTGAEPATDYLTWRFTARATATEGRELQRVKVRLAGGSASLVASQPRDRGVRPKEAVTVDLPASGAPVRFRPPAGRLNSYFGDHLYHVSWVRTDESGPDCCRRAEVGGITRWSVVRGLGMAGRFRLEAWVR
jgi:hypothetical protein